MTQPSELEPDERSSQAGPLRTAAIIATIIGAVGSVAFTLMAGHRNRSIVLVLMFVCWVISPFLALLRKCLGSKPWPSSIQTAFQWLSLALTLCSLLIYGTVALGPPRPQPAAMFLMVPLLSWLLIAVLSIIARWPRRSTS